MYHKPVKLCFGSQLAVLLKKPHALSLRLWHTLDSLLPLARPTRGLTRDAMASWLSPVHPQNPMADELPTLTDLQLFLRR